MADDDKLVAHIAAMQGLRDKTICHTKITGQGHRFHGFRQFNLARARDILLQMQKKICFLHTPRNFLEIEIRAMEDPRLYAGVVDPAHIIQEPYSLQMIGRPINSGTVCKTSYAWKPAIIDDKFLHKLCAHPYVLDAAVEPGRLHVYTIEDRNIEGGIVQSLQLLASTNRQWHGLRQKQPTFKHSKQPTRKRRHGQKQRRQQAGKRKNT